MSSTGVGRQRTPNILSMSCRHRRRQHGASRTGDSVPVVLLDYSYSRGGRKSMLEERNGSSLPSALHLLGKNKIYGVKRNDVLKIEMVDLEEKRGELRRENVKSTGSEMKNVYSSDKKAFILQERLEKLGRVSQEKSVTETREMAKANSRLDSTHMIEDGSLVSAQNNRSKHFDVEALRKKMERISKGMYERMEEEYGAMLLSNTHTPYASSSKRFEFAEDSSLSTRPPHKEAGTRKCSGQCKTIVRRIMEQVKEESKQWSEMQDMLGQVRKEIEQLKASRDFWHNRALDSEYQLEAIHSNVQEWKTKALAFKTKAKQLKREVSALRREPDHSGECQNEGKMRTEVDPKIISLGAHIAKEKRETVCSLKEKENHCPRNKEIEQEMSNNHGRRKSQIFDHGLGGPKRIPFRSIGNAALTKTRQRGKANFPSYENC